MYTTKQSLKFRLPALLAAAGLALAGCGSEEGQEQEPRDHTEGGGAEGDGAQPDERTGPFATAELMDADEETIGQVEFYDRDVQTEVVALVEDFDPGFYGFHIHSIGECEPDSEDPNDPENTGDFLSAGGHLTADDAENHPEHAGDMPPLHVNEDGTATMSFHTDRLDELLLIEGEQGTAVMVHSDPDNFANVPERYLDGDEPDEDTLNTGDAGNRLACGVIEG